MIWASRRLAKLFESIFQQVGRKSDVKIVRFPLKPSVWSYESLSHLLPCSLCLAIWCTLVVAVDTKFHL